MGTASGMTDENRRLEGQCRNGRVMAESHCCFLEAIDPGSGLQPVEGERVHATSVTSARMHDVRVDLDSRYTLTND